MEIIEEFYQVFKSYTVRVYIHLLYFNSFLPSHFKLVWDVLYDPASSADVGTLFQARNFLNARNVKRDPMKCVNACEDLMMKYSEALIVTAFKTHCKEKGT